jgi:hypothetical protein
MRSNGRGGPDAVAGPIVSNLDRFEWERAVRESDLPWPTKSVCLLLATWMDGGSAKTFKATQFVVKANGAWSIEVSPLFVSTSSGVTFLAPTVPFGTTATGTGDGVVIITGAKSATKATITGNKASRYFGVGANGENVVNTTDVYSGVVPIEPLSRGAQSGSIVFTVTGSGGWTIAVS